MTNLLSVIVTVETSLDYRASISQVKSSLVAFKWNHSQNLHSQCNLLVRSVHSHMWMKSACRQNHISGWIEHVFFVARHTLAPVTKCRKFLKSSWFVMLPIPVFKNTTTRSSAELTVSGKSSIDKTFVGVAFNAIEYRLESSLTKSHCVCWCSSV